MILGVDVSSFQPRVDWRQLRIDGCQFASVRCCEGLNLDSMHDTHIRDAISEGFKVGSYQVGHPSQDVTKLAEFFLKHANIIPGHLMPSPDMETLAAGHVPDNAGPWTDEWCEIVKRHASVDSLIYSAPSYYLTMLAQRPSLGGPFGWDWWMAWYCGATQPKSYGGQSLTYVAHQFEGNVPLRGQVGMWDLDVVYAESIDALLIPE
jgi:GH25 family lysozyme M1 (1,4-beta-N-acetylmuramidase)